MYPLRANAFGVAQIVGVYFCSVCLLFGAFIGQSGSDRWVLAKKF